MDRRITASNHYIHAHRTINERPVMEFKEVVEDRYSCKKFNGEPVAEKALKAILEAGRVAPTAKNLQEQHVYVVQSPEKLALIDELTPCRYGATTVLVVAFNKENVFTYPGGTRDSGIEDATIVATHMMLAAKNAGADSCWVNFFNPEEVAEKLELPENEEVLMMLDLGYAAEDGKPLPNHASRKPLSGTVTYL
jgi:nitroreductase